MFDIAPIADEAFAVLDTGRQVAPFSGRYPADLDAAYRVTAAVRAKREAAGAGILGRKIGLTDRTIWAEYEVYAPMWGYIYDRTVHRLADCRRGFRSCRPRRTAPEPEIMVRFARAPAPGMDERALLSCVEWVSHGYEIVQSIFPAWNRGSRHRRPAIGLHGALFVGEPKLCRPRLAEKLSTVEIDLIDGKVWTTATPRTSSTAPSPPSATS